MQYNYYQLKLIAKLERLNGLNDPNKNSFKNTLKRYYNCKSNFQSDDAYFYIGKSERSIIRSIKYSLLMDIKYDKYKEYSNKNYFDLLPNEIIDKIFDYFSHYDLASFSEAYPFYLDQTMNPNYWKFIRISLNQTLFNDEEVLKLIEYLNKNLRQLSFKEHYIDSLEIFLDRRVQLIKEEIFLSYFNLTPNLVYLEMCTINFPIGSLIDTIVNTLTKLEFICFGHNEIIDTDLIKLKKLKNLNSIDLSWSYGYSNDGVFELISNLRKLINFNVQSDNDGLVLMKKETIELILNNYSSTLLSLCINGSQLADDCFYNLSNCIYLKKFSIKRGTSLTNGFFENLNKLNSLESLSLIKMSNIHLSLSDFGMNLKQLKHLSFEGCRINDEILVNLPISCPFLEELILNHTFGITECGLNTIVTECKEINYLDFTFCSGLHFTLFQFVPSVYLKKLKIIILNYCNEIKDYDLNFSQLITSENITIIKNF